MMYILNKMWSDVKGFLGFKKPERTPINVVPSSSGSATQNITSDEAHQTTKAYGTYVDRFGQVHNLNRIPEPTQELQVEFVAMSDVNTSFQELMEKIDSMQTIKYNNSINNMEAKSQAELFTIFVRQDHGYPDFTDADTAKKWGVDGFGYRWNAQGFYKLAFVDFHDGSSWEKGKAYA